MTRQVRRSTHARGANFVEYMIVVGVIAVSALVGFEAFGKNSSELAKTQGDCVQAMGCGQGESFPASSMNANGGGGGDDRGHLGRAWDGAWNGTKTGFGATVSFGEGFLVDGAWGTVKGIGELAYNVATDPVGTGRGLAEGVKSIAQNPSGAWNSVKSEMERSWNEDPARAIGNGVFQIASVLVPVTKAGYAGKVAQVADKAADAGRVADVAATANIARKAGDPSRIVVHAPGTALDGSRRIFDIPADTTVYRVQAKDLPLSPHESPYFDNYSHLGTDGRMLPPGKYEALYVSPDKKALEDLRRSQGYFDNGDVMHEAKLGELVDRSGAGTIVFEDTKFKYSIGADAYVIVRPVPPHTP